MHECVVKVEWVTSSVDADYAPIHFSAVTDGEQRILRTFVREDGYGTCEITDAFRRFVERVGRHRDRQEEDVVCLAHGGRYFGLYVGYFGLYMEQQDMVFSME